MRIGRTRRGPGAWCRSSGEAAHICRSALAPTRPVGHAVRVSLTPDDDAEHWRDQIAHDTTAWGDDPSEVSAGARGWLERPDEVPTARGTDIDPLLAEALAPVLRDLANTCTVSLE